MGDVVVGRMLVVASSRREFLRWCQVEQIDPRDRRLIRLTSVHDAQMLRGLRSEPGDRVVEVRWPERFVDGEAIVEALRIGGWT